MEVVFWPIYLVRYLAWRPITTGLFDLTGTQSPGAQHAGHEVTSSPSI